MRITLAIALAAVAATAAMMVSAPASGGNVPNWTFELRVSRWVAPSRFFAVVVKQTSGLKVRRDLPLTLVLDRRTSCSRSVAGATPTSIPCRTLRPLVTVRPLLPVAVSGQFETGHLGRIGFRARTVLVRG